jgi:hypothetical protein
MVAAGKKITDYRREELVWKKNLQPHAFRLQLRKQGWKEAA